MTVYNYLCVYVCMCVSIPFETQKMFGRARFHLCVPADSSRLLQVIRSFPLLLRRRESFTSPDAIVDEARAVCGPFAVCRQQPLVARCLDGEYGPHSLSSFLHWSTACRRACNMLCPSDHCTSVLANISSCCTRWSVGEICGSS